MEFKEMTREEYAALSMRDLLSRQKFLGALVSKSDEPSDELVADVERCGEEVASRMEAIASKDKREKAIDALKMGEGKTLMRMGDEAASRAEEVDEHDTTEYRKAFMEAVQRGLKGAALPKVLRANQAIGGTFEASTDTPLQIPTTMQREIVKKMEERGGIYAKVRKISIQGGIWFRVRDMKVTASWIGEKEVSEAQKVADDTQLMFSYNQLECRIQRTLLSAAVTFEDFQKDFVQAVADAMVDALEQAIVRGTGTAQPLGIVNDKRIPASQIVEMTEADIADWVKWHTMVKAAIPKQYRKNNSTYIMNQGTWDINIETLRDSQNHPVSQTGYNPVTGEDQYRLMGKDVETVDDPILPSFADAKAGEVFAIFGDLSNYLLNTQPGMQMTVKTWDDDDNNLRKTRALMACDGKLLDPYGFVLLKKKASA